MERRKQEHKKTILLGFITCKVFNFKVLRTEIFEGGYYHITPRGAIYGVKCICYDPKDEHIWG
jgi:hypothetical protein